MEEKSTREIIMQEALTMFAVKGYAAVSMRDIAAAVGIRASSIYHHFSGKQELWNRSPLYRRGAQMGYVASYGNEFYGASAAWDYYRKGAWDNEDLSPFSH